jgi:hypothetical protein
LANATGVTYQAGDGFNDVSFTIRGSQADINTFFDGMIFTPDDDFEGIAKLTVTADDLGNTGTGGNQTDSDDVFISVHKALTSTGEIPAHNASSQVQKTYDVHRGSQNAVGLLSDGRYVVVWTSNNTAEAGTNDVYARILKSDGSEDVAQFVVNDVFPVHAAAANQGGASVAVNQDGTFVVVFDDWSSPMMAVASLVAATHHEQWDGSGYPQGLKGTDIPIEGRITAVADVFDALSTRRPYKAAIPLDECFQMIKEKRGTHFDPDIVDAFLRRRPEILQVAADYADSSN